MVGRRHGKWKSETVAPGNTENSVASINKTSRIIGEVSKTTANISEILDCK